jgi:hypothetical protein
VLHGREAVILLDNDAGKKRKKKAEEGCFFPEKYSGGTHNKRNESQLTIRINVQ